MTMPPRRSYFERSYWRRVLRPRDDNMDELIESASFAVGLVVGVFSAAIVVSVLNIVGVL
jgi:hypothetical protein